MVCFSEDDIFDDMTMKKIVDNIKYLNKALRCLGIFRNKLKKGWKLSEERLKFILKKDVAIEGL